MSEKIIVTKHEFVCDLCGHRIPKGSKCRMIRDDFMPGLIYFEHLRCPSAPAVATENSNPKHPITYNKSAMALA